MIAPTLPERHACAALLSTAFLTLDTTSHEPDLLLSLWLAHLFSIRRHFLPRANLRPQTELSAHTSQSTKPR
jgi:hypothetical protein